MTPTPDSRAPHEHLFHDSGAETEHRTLRVVLLTLTMMVVEIVAGWLYGSMALQADGWHMSTHAAALGLSWLAFMLARRYALDRRFAFGTWKIEILGGFVSAILLGVVALGMVFVSVERLLHPVPIQFNQAILVAVIGLVVNLASALLLTGRHPHGHQGGAHDHDHDHAAGNLNLRAAYLHVVADAVTSVLAIGALLGGKFMAWTWLDPAMGLVGAALIARWTWGLLRETGSILLDHDSNVGLAAEIRAAVETDGDTRVTDLHVWRVGPDQYACILGLAARAPHPLETYRDRLASIHELAHLTIEIGPHPDALP